MRFALLIQPLFNFLLPRAHQSGKRFLPESPSGLVLNLAQHVHRRGMAETLSNGMNAGSRRRRSVAGIWL
jgi:hypothetical protein